MHPNHPHQTRRPRSATTSAATRNTNTATPTIAPAAGANSDAAAHLAPPRASLDSVSSPSSARPAGPHHVSYDMAAEAAAAADAPSSRHLSPPVLPVHSLSDSEVPPYAPASPTAVSPTAGGGTGPGSAAGPGPGPGPMGMAGLRRRSSRAPTFRTFDGGDDYDVPFSSSLGWHPGAEPGYDPKLPDGGHASVPTLSAACEITVVDYSLDRIEQHHFGNDGFIEFLKQPQESWVKCRWININGLSWDVIQAVGTTKGLHKLAIEDIMNLRNRTKVDW